MLLSFFNLIRLIFYLIFLAPLFFINKEKALYIFLKFAGPSFIKLGQLLSVRSDLVGTKIAITLAKFQDKIPPFSLSKTHRILIEEYGKNFNEIFNDFDFNPVASASIAQVHKASLKNNQQVAVKIIRPNIQKEMMRDIATIRLISRITKFFSVFLAKTFSDIEYLLTQTARYELDLLHEGANGSKLKDEMMDAKGFYVPTIFWQYSSARILVIEWIDGISFSNHQAIQATKFDKKILAENLVLSYFRQVYVNGFFHADMHPGNLFLTPKGDIAVVDFGIMGKIDKKTRIAVAEVLIGFLHRDYKRVAEIHIEAGFVPDNTNIDDLAISCRKIGEMIVGVNVKDISIAKLLTNLIALTKDYNMDTKPELLLLQKTLLLVEGVGVTLDPDLNIWDLARPWVKEWAKTNIGFDAKVADAIMDILKIVKNFIKKQ